MPALTRRHLPAGAAATSACAAMPPAAIEAVETAPFVPEPRVIGGHTIAVADLVKLGTVRIVRGPVGYALKSGQHPSSS
jgi:hypothetical protein